MSVEAQVAAPHDASAPKRRTIASRLGGLLMDAALLALFLALGVACLDILVKLVVLIVGFFQRPPAVYIERGLAQWDSNRHRDDFLWLLASVAAAGGLFFLFRGGLRLRRALLSRVIDASFESFVGKRYLLSREGGSLVNLITTVSVAGVSVGVMALVVVISVMNGFDRTLMDKMMGVFAHVQIWPYSIGEEAEFTQEQTDEMLAMLDAMPGVAGAAPLLQSKSLLQASGGASADKVPALIQGLDVEREKNVTRIMGNIVRGTSTPGDGEIVLGSEVARKLQVVIGDPLYVLSGKVVSTGRGPTPKISKLRVSGVFQTGLHDVDDNFAYTSVRTLQRLTLSEGKISSIHIRLEDPHDAGEMKFSLLDKLPGGALVQTWQEMNKDFFQALYVEKVAMFIILLLIVLVAALNIVGTLVMTVTQKTREIGILKSMGASDGMVLRIFLFNGMFIGLVGTSMGVACGLWLCRFVERDIDKIFQLPPGVYGLDRLPVIVEWPTMALIVGVSLAVCTLAGLLPSIRASRLNPVEALRHD